MATIFKEISQREIHLVPFPFSDFSGTKVRPVLVVSNNEFNKKSQDVIVCGVTSQDINEIEVQKKDLEEGILFKKSNIKAESILKVKKDLLIKKIAKVNKRTHKRVIKRIFEIIK